MNGGTLILPLGNAIVINLSGNLSGEAFTVNTPSATINNYATNGIITISDVSGSTWNEYANGNTLTFADPDSGTNLTIIGNPSGVTLNSEAIITIADNATIATPIVINSDVTIISSKTVAATIAADKKVTTKADAEEGTTGVVVIGNGETTTVNPEVPTDVTVANVLSESDFKAALLNEEVQTINLSTSFEVEEPLQINRKVTVNGNNKIITKANGFRILTAPNNVKVNSVVVVSATGTEINNLTVDAKGKTDWEGLYAIQVYNSADVNLNGVTVKNADGGLLVNGSTVIANDITTSGNEFGGIEVSHASGITAPTKLTITGKSTHTAEEVYIWTVGANATVVDSGSQYKSGQDIRDGKEQFTNYIFKSEDRPVPYTILHHPLDGLKELAVAGLIADDVKFLVFGLNDENGTQKVATIDEVTNYIFTTYGTPFNYDAIVIVDGKISIDGSILGMENWNKVKENGNKKIPYRITVLNKEKNNKIAKIAMYQDGHAVIEEVN